MPHARSLARASAIATVVLLALGVTPALASPPTLTLAAPPVEGWVATSHPDFQGTTSDLLDPLDVSVYAGPLATGTPVCSIAALVEPSGEWSASCEEALPDGQYTAMAEQSELGEAAVAGPQSFVIDTVAPSVSLQAPPTYTNDAAPTLQGTAGTEAGDLPAVLIRIYAGTGTGGTPLLEETVTPVGGSWSYAPAALADGTYTVQALQRDQAGNEGRSQADTFTVDLTAPVVTVQSPAQDAQLKVARPTISGTAGTAAGDMPDVKVAIYGSPIQKGEKPLYEVELTANEKGVWSTGSSGPELANGIYTLIAEQEDQAGNVGKSEQVTFSVSGTPLVTLFGEGLVRREGTSVSGPEPTFSGQGSTLAEDAVEVRLKLYEGDSPTGSPLRTLATPLSGSSWSTGLGAPLADGTYTIQAEQEGPLAQPGFSLPVTFTVDADAPAVTLTTPANGATVGGAGVEVGGQAGQAPGDDPQVTVKIYAGESVGVSLVETGSATASGDSWSARLGGLSPGTYTAVAEQDDDVGNVGVSKAVSFSVSNSPVVTLSGEGLVRREGLLFAGPDPSFSGEGATGAGDGRAVTLKLYRGESTTGEPLQTASAVLSRGFWSTGFENPLSDGTYTVEAEQEGPAGQPGFSSPVTFTVDADAPMVTLTTPADGTAVSAGAGLQAGGQAGEGPGDAPEVTVRVYAGASAGASPVETATGTVSGGSWTARLGALTPGTYTALAEQDDDVGNVGTSAPSTFTVAAPSAPPPPTASFNWFPAEPHVGEAVSLVSTSTDPTSAIVGYAWNLTGGGGLSPGAQTASTSFATPGAHSVSLEVTDALGATGTVTESIQVAAQPLVLMQPFPVVRIAGSEGTRNVTIRLLTVQAPAGASVTIVCRGRGCPTKRLDTVAPARKSGVGSGPVLLTIHRFERRLPVGVVLEIRVGKAGEIGKYTKFVTRRGKLPVRTDSCLAPTGNPMECPST